MKEIVYFLLGAVFGALVALLLAPQSGEELRTKIQTTAEADWQKFNQEWQAGLEKTNQRLDQIQAQLKQTLNQEAAKGQGGDNA